MSNDLLRDATQALKEGSDGRSSGAPETRGRLIETLERKQYNRRVATLVATVVVVMFCASTSWAAITGRLPAMVQEIINVIAPDDDDHQQASLEGSSQVAGTPRRQGARGRPAATEARVNEVESPEAEQEIPETPETTPAEPPVSLRPAPQSQEPSRPPTTSTRSPRPVVSETPASQLDEPESPELTEPAPPTTEALYQRAHDAHFVRHDFSAALTAWDLYLAAAPGGRFALEARYNRAIALVRLGRRQSAISALRPFAEGVHGGYRQPEARRLIQTLERFAPSETP